jgi:uncharacterized membrane protein
MQDDISQIRTFPTRRTESLTDAVFAIAMTLLVLGLSVPVLSSNATNQDLWQALAKMRPSFTGFLISFLILGVMWSVHMRMFEQLDTIDERVSKLNIFRLLMVVLLPFTTSLTATYPGLLPAQLLYPLNLFFLALATYLQGLYVQAHPSFYKVYNKRRASYGKFQNLSFVIVSVIVLGMVFVIGELALLIFFVLPIIDPLSRRFSKH